MCRAGALQSTTMGSVLTACHGVVGGYVVFRPGVCFAVRSSHRYLGSTVNAKDVQCDLRGRGVESDVWSGSLSCRRVVL